MGLFDAFSGKRGRQAASAIQGATAATHANINTLLNRGEENQLGALAQYYPQAQGLLQQAGAAFNPYAEGGARGFGLYQDALGVNGPAGNARATGAFQAGPGYQWQVDQATDAAARKASALGLMGSGNTLSAIAGLGSNLANQEYGGWLARLQGLGQTGLQGATGQANAFGAQGQLMADQGNRTAGIHGSTAGAKANAELALLQPQITAIQGAAQAGNQASENRLNAVMEGAKTLASLFGGSSGGGGNMASLGKLFGI